MEDKETELLSKVTANHLFLGQFEPFRATLHSLRARSPDLARTILQTIISQGGRLGTPDPVIWSDSCPSPAILTFLCTIELLQFTDATLNIWSFSPNILKLRSEFLLYVHIISSRVLETVKDGVNTGLNDNLDAGSVMKEELRVLERLSEVGLNRLRPDLICSEEIGEWNLGGLGEGELMTLRGSILENPEIFDVLCANIGGQVGCVENEDSGGLAIALKKDGRRHEEKEEELLRLVQKCVQITHLDAMRQCLENGDEDGAVLHVRFLHLNSGVEEAEYSMVLQDLLRRVLSGVHDYGDTSITMRTKVFSIYTEALSSHCTRLVQMLQIIQDDLLSQEIDAYSACGGDQIPLPLQCLQKSIAQLTSETVSAETSVALKVATNFCMRDMYHYARVRGLHALECVVDTALSLVRKEQIQEACQVLMLFPRLQPLVAALGWDFLAGKTTMRRKLMQSLWTSKSQALRLEEPTRYHDKLDEVSCVENLCDTLCYRLDIASFVARNNSGQSWSLKSSILLSGKDLLECGNGDAEIDPFVENFVLERLSVQSPLRVMFDLVPHIEFPDAIELLSMQPITSTSEAWKRMQDVELMHMRYALETAVLALGSMEKSTTDGTGHQQMAFFCLKELKNHFDAITNASRKIYMVNIIISLLYMDNLQIDLVPYDPIRGHSKSFSGCGGEQADVTFHEGGNEMVVSFTGQVLNILRQQLPSSISDLDNSLDGHMSAGSKQALEWRILKAKRFIEDWEWRLSILQRLLPLSERQWRWKEALTVLRAAPSKLLNFCMQRAKYDIGEEAISRFSLPPEDKATLELTEWVDAAFRKTSVEDVMSRAADVTSVQELDFLSLRSQLGPLAAILLCIDVAAGCSKLPSVSLKLLNQAQIMLSEIYPGSAPKIGSNYWDQIREVAIISIVKRVLKRLCELLEQIVDSGISDQLRVTELILNDQDFFRKLLELFRMCEDVENLDGLHLIFKIVRGIILLNSAQIFEKIFGDELIMDIMGCLEYDPEAPHAHHRKFLKEHVVFKEVVPIKDPVVLSKIHQTYRVNYLKDVVLPRALDEAIVGNLNSIVHSNNAVVVSLLKDDNTFIKELFARLKSPNISIESKETLVHFLHEFCTLSKSLQMVHQHRLFRDLASEGIFDIIADVFQSEDYRLVLIGTDILILFQSLDANILRSYASRQEGGLLGLLVKNMLADFGDTMHCQFFEILRSLLEPLTAGSQRESLVEVFYEKHMGQLIDVLTSSCLPNSNGQISSKSVSSDVRTRSQSNVKPEILLNICELLSFCVVQHPYRIKCNFLLNNVVDKVLLLTKRREKYLVVAAVRFARALISRSDEHLMNHLVKNNLLKPIIDAFVANGDRYNLLNSAVLDLFEYIRKENLKVLLRYLVDTFWDQLAKFENLSSIQALKVKYEQSLESVGTTSTGSLLDQRKRLDERALEKEEEDYFNEDSDEEDSASARAGNTKRRQSQPPVLVNGSSPNGPSPRSGGLVDYDDDEEDEDYKPPPKKTADVSDEDKGLAEFPLKRKLISKEEPEKKRSQRPPRGLKPKESVLAAFCSTLTGAGKKLSSSALNIPPSNINQRSVEPNPEAMGSIAENSEREKHTDKEDVSPRSCGDGLNESADNRNHGDESPLLPPKSSPEMAVNGS